MTFTNRICLVVAVTAIAAILTVCGTNRTVQQRTTDADVLRSEVSAEVIVGINDFGFELLRHTSGLSGPNTVFSPYSISSILAMTASGARGVTGAEMRQVMHVSEMKPATIQKQWGQLNAEISERSPDQKLKVANAAWVREGQHLQPDFLATVRSAFNAQISTVDFASNDVATIVNSWVAAHTDSMISQIVGNVDPRAMLLLVDAIYFKGAWDIPFRCGGTYNTDFTLPDGSTVKVPMMSRWHGTQIIETSSFLIARLPYKGSDSAMYLMLPDENMGLTQLEQTVTGTQFLEAARAAAMAIPRANTVLGLPRLDLAWGQQNLMHILSAMGMPSAFNPATADFSGLVKENQFWIGQLAHKARVKVGELGTEAAAATAKLFVGGRPTVIRFNRPFLFAIVDERSGAILFLGEVTDPRAN